MYLGTCAYTPTGREYVLIFKYELIFQVYVPTTKRAISLVSSCFIWNRALFCCRRFGVICYRNRLLGLNLGCPGQKERVKPGISTSDSWRGHSEISQDVQDKRDVLSLGFQLVMVGGDIPGFLGCPGQKGCVGSGILTR